MSFSRACLSPRCMASMQAASCSALSGRGNEPDGEDTRRIQKAAPQSSAVVMENSTIIRPFTIRMVQHMRADAVWLLGLWKNGIMSADSKSNDFAKRCRSIETQKRITDFLRSSFCICRWGYCKDYSSTTLPDFHAPVVPKPIAVDLVPSYTVTPGFLSSQMQSMNSCISAR